MHARNLTPDIDPFLDLPSIIEAHFGSRRAFLASSSIGSRSCSLHVDHRKPIPPASRVQLRVKIAGESPVFSLAGTAAATARAGALRVEFGGADLGAFAKLYAFARRVPSSWGRRADERIEVALPVEVETESGPLLRGFVADLSRGGARLMLPAARIHLESRVELAIRVGLIRKVRARGQVVWTNRHAHGLDVGLAFDGMDVAERFSLNELLQDQRGGASR